MIVDAKPASCRCRARWAWAACFMLLGVSAHAAPPVVIEPSAPFRVPAGQDFATQELGDPWDFDSIHDVFSGNSMALGGEQVVNGVYSFDTLETDLPGKTRGHFWLIHPGTLNTQMLVTESRNEATGRRLFTREKFSIDPQAYRYFTARVRMTSATAQPLTSDQPFVVYYFEDYTSIGNALFGVSKAVRVPPGEWFVVAIDLATEVDPNSPESWPLLPQVDGLRVNPTNNPDVHVEIDWVRLSGDSLSGEGFAVEWQGNGAASYEVSALSRDTTEPTALVLAGEVEGSSTNVSLSRLPPGDYDIVVSGDGETGTAAGVVSVNDVPLVQITRPNIKGEQSLGYGAVVNSNPWSSIDAGDAAEVLGFESWSFSNPVGSLTGRPESESSRVLMNTPLPIDTAYYRMLCFEVEVMGPKDVQFGSVTKVLWGNFRSKLTTPRPVITQDGMNEYCVGDMAELEIDPNSPEGSEGAWVGPISYIRFDPHEFQRTEACDNSPGPENCRDVRFDSMVLAPFHNANPDFRFEWKDSDSDDNALVQLWLDDDRTPGNTPGSTEIKLGEFLENASGDHLDWSVPAGVTPGRWYVYAIADDGMNGTLKYANGPLLVGPPDSVSLSIDEPDGVGDEMVSGWEYGLRARGNPWDMQAPEFDLSRQLNISGLALDQGILSGTAANNDPQFILMTTLDGDPEIATPDYRYLAMKVRFPAGAGPHFVQLFFGSDPEAAPSTMGFTKGIPVEDDQWNLVVIDLHQDIAGTSSRTWTGIPTVRSLRVDPTTKPGARFEIDWITLTPLPAPATEYAVHWSTRNTGTSVFDVNLIDQAGHRFPMVAGLPSATRSHTINLSRWPLGKYYAEVVAQPGPAALSPGAIELLSAPPVAEVLFKDGFEP